MSIDLFMTNGAHFSDDRKYRYVLWRRWDESKPMVAFIGLNPSTAAENKNDNTITKLRKISAFNGYGGFYMLNLFALVSTDPNALIAHPDPLGENDGHLTATVKLICDGNVVFAWGAFKQAKERAEVVKSMFPNGKCLWRNKDGSPKHPLYCLDQTLIIPYEQ